MSISWTSRSSSFLVVLCWSKPNFLPNALLGLIIARPKQNFAICWNSLKPSEKNCTMGNQQETNFRILRDFTRNKKIQFLFEEKVQPLWETKGRFNSELVRNLFSRAFIFVSVKQDLTQFSKNKRAGLNRNKRLWTEINFRFLKSLCLGRQIKGQKDNCSILFCPYGKIYLGIYSTNFETF